jgi:hypothetical protein
MPEHPKPTAVAIAGYNRPDYFRPSIHSLLGNRRIEHCDLWCFFDGGRSSRQDEYRHILEEALDSGHSPHTVSFAGRTENLGCERNLIDLRRQLFDEQRYERVFVFEDDLIVSPHYLQLSEALLDWAVPRFSDIGAVQAYNDCWLTVEEKRRRLDEVEVGNPHWWGYLIPRTTWNAIKNTLYEYEERFLGHGDYPLDHVGIRNWTISKLREALQAVGLPSAMFRGGHRFPYHWNFYEYFEREFALGQDSMTVLAMTLAGLQKLVTTVNRAQPIGVKGLHSTPDFFTTARLDRVVLDRFESDSTRDAFCVRLGRSAH